MFLSEIPVDIYCSISDAASCGNINYLERILLLCDNNITKHAINSALTTACCSGWVEMVQWLLKNGADPNIKDELGKTSLYWIFAGNGWNIGHKYRTNYPEKYIEIFKIMFRYGMKIDYTQIELARLEINSNYHHLLPILNLYNKSANIIQKQFKKSCYDPDYIMCKNIMKKYFLTCISFS